MQLFSVQGCILPVIAALENKKQSTSDNVRQQKCSKTALHQAVRLVWVLVDQGADLHAIDCEGMTPYDLALKSNIQEIIQLTYLETDEEKIRNRTLQCNSTPLHHAIHSAMGLIKQGSSLQDLGCLFTPYGKPGKTTVRVVENLDNQKKNTAHICCITPLHLAVITKDTKNIELLLQIEENMYAIDCEGRTPIEFAVLDNNYKVILRFINAHFDVKRKLNGSPSLLHRAISIGSLGTVKFLLGLDIYNCVIEREGSGLLFEALLFNRTDIAQYVIDEVEKRNYLNETGDTYIHKFSEEGNTQVLSHLKKLKLINKELVNVINKKNETSLYKAVKGNYHDIVKILLASGANASDIAKDGKTYLHVAIRYKSREALHTLLESGLPADSKDINGITPMLFAVRENDTDSMAILKDFGSDLYQNFGKYSNSLLHEAALSGSTEALVWLLGNGHSVDEKNNEEFTALHLAATKGKVSTVKHLISFNANVNALALYNDTPLHWASLNGNIAIIKDLISSGGDVNAEQNCGWTPLHIAAWFGHLAAVEELISKGADVNPLNELGYTPLHYAILQKHNEVADYIKSEGGYMNKVE